MNATDGRFARSRGVIQSAPLLGLVIAGMATWLVANPACGEVPACISAIAIDHTEIVDDSTILFHMRDRSIYRNVLLQRCVGLQNDPRGFTYAPTDNNDALCSNLVTIRTNSFHEICQLGAFVRVK